MDKTLMSEIEDAIRVQSRHMVDIARPWPQLRAALIRATAAMALFIEDGDRRAAAEAQAQDEGGDRTGESQGRQL